MIEVGDVIKFRNRYFVVQGIDRFNDDRKYYDIVDIETGANYYSLLPFIDECTVYGHEEYCVLPGNIRRMALDYI